MEGSLSTRANTIFPSLILMYEKLVELGFIYVDGKVEYIGEFKNV